MAFALAFMLYIYAVNTGTALVTSPDSKAYGLDRIWRPHDIGLISYSKVSTVESGFKSLRIQLSDSSYTCGRKVHPQRKVSRFKSVAGYV